ncbi:phosphotransferase family protein [Halobaculum sp. MBLA0147]|uniref:phosphotransferase family protein n=1 Tax=Halobaculum sp. MBLA0147 TaxID=3079934 RepID=UPI0035253E28
MSPFTTDEVRAAAATLRPGATVESVSEIAPGKNAVYHVRFDDRETVLKLGTESPERVRAEPAVIALVADATTVPVPTVVAASDEVLSVPCVLFDRVAGETVDDLSPDLSSATLARVADAAGRHLASLHESTSFDGVGPLVPDDTGPTPGGPDRGWQSLLCRTATAKIDRLPASFDDHRDAIRDGVERVLAAWDGPDGVDSVLAHMDYRPANLVLDTGAEPVVRAVLDWGGAAAAPPAYELAHVETLLTAWPGVDDPPRLRDPLRASYTTVAGVDSFPDVPAVYRLDATLRVGKHLELFADRRSDVSTATLAEDTLDSLRSFGVLE